MVPLHRFPQKSPRVLPVFNHAWWRWAFGGWPLVAVGGGWRRMVVGDWWLVAVGSGWWLVAVGGWRLVVPWGGT